MKKAILLLITISTFQLGYSQVGINNTDPKSTLDITATNVATPSNTDGILIPRIDDFPSTNPGADQDGMMVFTTGNGTPTKGFYYWDEPSMSWVSITGAVGPIKIDDLTDAKSDADGTNDGSSIFFGINAGANDDGTDNRNIGIGFDALSSNTTGSLNVAIGHSSFENNITGANNSTVGFLSLAANTTGITNSAYGYQSMLDNTEGNNNSAYGSQSLHSNTTGNSNVGIGLRSVYSNSTGAGNVGIGFDAGYNTLGSRSVFIGFSAGYFETAANRLYIESSDADADNALVYGEFDNDILRTNGEFQIGNPASGGFALPTADGVIGEALITDGAGGVSWAVPSDVDSINNLTDGKSDNDGSNDGSSVFLGINSGTADDSSDNRNVGVGFQTLEDNTIGSQNTAIGFNALLNNIDGGANTAIGAASLTTNTSGIWNTAIGQSSLSANVDGAFNTALGRGSMLFNNDGNSNVALGVFALSSNSSGSFNTVIGTEAATALTADNANTIIGQRAMNSFTAGASNVAIGASTAYYGSGSENTYLGTTAGFTPSAPARSGSVFVGYGAGSAETTSNKLYIENSVADADNALIYGEFDNDILRTNGELQIGNPASGGFALPTTDGTANQVLATNGSGQVSWAASGGATKSIVSVAMTNSVAVPISSWMKLPFDAENFDTNSEYDTTSYRFVATNSGYYRVNAAFFGQASGASHVTFSIGMFVNAVLIRETNQKLSAGLGILHHINNNIYLNAGDYVEIHAFNGSTFAPWTITPLGNEQMFYFEIEQID